jgi:hypothetical protein
MLEASMNGATGGAAAGREDQRAVGELGFVAGGRASVRGAYLIVPIGGLCVGRLDGERS